MAHLVKNLPTMQETWVQSLGWEDPLEKGMATHSSLLAGEFYGLYRIYSPWGHKESDVTEQLSLYVNHPALKRFYFVDIHLENWRGKWQATLVFLPRESHGQRSLVGYSPWGHKESDTTE